jgi:hypothetical protein
MDPKRESLRSTTLRVADGMSAVIAIADDSEDIVVERSFCGSSGAGLGAAESKRLLS